MKLFEESNFLIDIILMSIIPAIINSFILLNFWMIIDLFENGNYGNWSIGNLSVYLILQ